MTNSDILRRLRYALNLDNAGMIRLFDLGGHAPSPAELDLVLKKDEDPAGMDCPDRLLLAFLDGLVASRRGVRDAGTTEPEALDNTLVLRKLRIALQLKDTDMQRILAAGGMDVSRSELSALFRNPGHRNFVPCRDQLLRKFLAGLATISREDLQ
jgi:uncharacterized protein YehS (DUF1456 family)